MATTATPQALRAIADLIESGELPPPDLHGLFVNQWHVGGVERVREAFVALRRHPQAVVTTTSDDYYVVITVPVADTTVEFKFLAVNLGTKRTVTRPVDEFVLDPELLTDAEPEAVA